jgi:hypothetical protein
MPCSRFSAHQVRSSQTRLSSPTQPAAQRSASSRLTRPSTTAPRSASTSSTPGCPLDLIKQPYDRGQTLPVAALAPMRARDERGGGPPPGPNPFASRDALTGYAVVHAGPEPQAPAVAAVHGVNELGSRLSERRSRPHPTAVSGAHGAWGWHQRLIATPPYMVTCSSRTSASSGPGRHRCTSVTPGSTRSRPANRASTEARSRALVGMPLAL